MKKDTDGEVEKANHIKVYQTSRLTKLEYNVANKISTSIVNRWLDVKDDKTSNKKIHKISSRWVELKNHKKDQSINREKVNEFDSHLVKKGTQEVFVELEMKEGYKEYLQENSIPQRRSCGLPNVKYHYEGLDPKGEYKNYGITKENLDYFNRNLDGVRIVQ